MLRTQKAHTIKKQKTKKTLSSAEDDFLHSKSYESELMFTFNTPINNRGSHFDKKSPLAVNSNEGTNKSRGLSYSVSTTAFENDIFTKRSNNRIISSELCNDLEEQDDLKSDTQSQNTLEIGSFKSDMTQEIPSVLMMNVNNTQPPSYESVVYSQQPKSNEQRLPLPEYNHIVKKNPSSKLETNTFKINEILEREKYLSMPTRKSISLKESFDLSLLSKKSNSLQERSKSIIDEVDDYSSSSDGEYLPISSKKNKENSMKFNKKQPLVQNKEKSKEDWLVTQFLIDEYSVHGRAYENKRKTTDQGFGMLQEDMFESSSDEE